MVTAAQAFYINRRRRRERVADATTVAEFVASSVKTVDGTSFTHTVAFGSPFVGRKLVVGLGFRENVLVTVVSVTIGGVAATLIPGTQVDFTTSSLSTIAFYQAAVPEGASGDIVVTLSGTVLRCAIGVWSLRNGGTVADVGTSTADPATDTINVPAGGCVLGYALQTHNAAGVTATWSGLTERFDAQVEGNNTHTGADASYRDAIALPVSCDWSSTPATGGAATFVAFRPGDPLLRTVPDTANSFYVIVKGDSGADAIHFQRNTGSGGAGDLGSKWPEWRVTGRARLPSFEHSPTAPSVTFTDDPGAQDIVATSNGTVFMGSFHGLGAAGALNSETLTLDGETFDPTVASSGDLFTLRNSTTATDGTNSFTRDLTTAIGVGGSVRYKINSISKVGTISFIYLGMVIGSGAFNEADVQLTAGGSWKSLPTLGTSQAVTGQIKLETAIKGLRLRDTATGRAVQITGSAISALANYLRAELARVTSTDRLKGYFARFTDLTTLAGAEWETNAAVVATGSLEGTNLMTNGDFASGDLTGWTKASGAGTATVVGGVMNQVREAASNHRMRQTNVITAVVGDILAFRMDVNAVSAGAFPIARVANANTLSSTGAMINQTPVLGRNIFVFQANVTTIWPGDELSAGTAGQTADTDNYGLWKLN